MCGFDDSRSILCVFWQFFAIFFAIFGMYTCCPSGKPFLPTGQPYCAAPARLRFCGAWPTKTEPSGRRWRRCSRVLMVFSFSAFEWSFCLCAPGPPRSHLSIRATPPRASFPRLFKLGPRPALPHARRGGGAPSAQVTGHLLTPYNREPPNVEIPVLSPLHTYPSK